MTEESIFAAAIAIPDAPARAAYLDQACAGNVELRKQLDALVAAHFAADPRFDPATMSAAEFAATRGPDGTRSQTAAAETEGAVIAGRYKLRQQIGEGGMGTVWMADQTEPVKRKVAVKLIRVERGQSKAILARFEAERQAIALMDHPHIARLLDAGTWEAAPFFVMELVKGVPLTEFCDRHRLSVPDRLALFVQICGAVQHAHQKGVIHRDLKPSNIPGPPHYVFALRGGMPSST
ncbi:MAG: serine/threonine-protein kinase [Gemmataceae bacterium]